MWTTPLGPDDESRLDNGGTVLQSDDVDDYPESGYMAAGWHFNGSLAELHRQRVRRHVHWRRPDVDQRPGLRRPPAS